MFNIISQLVEFFFRKEVNLGLIDLQIAQNMGLNVEFRKPTVSDVGTGNYFFHDGYVFFPVIMQGDLCEFGFQPTLCSRDRAIAGEFANLIPQEVIQKSIKQEASYSNIPVGEVHFA